MGAAARGGAGQLGFFRFNGCHQPGHQIARHERRVGGKAGNPRKIRRMGLGPFESGEYARKGSGKARDLIAYDRQSKAGKPRRIAIGVENDAAHLQGDAIEDAGQQGFAAERAKLPL